jgi:hypothetical protein
MMEYKHEELFLGGKSIRLGFLTPEGVCQRWIKEVSDNSMDSTIAKVNGRLEKLAADTEPTIVYSFGREVEATHHLGNVN